MERADRLLQYLYGDEAGKRTAGRLEELLAERKPHLVPPRTAVEPGRSGDLPLTEADAVLITYGDQFREDGRPPLAVLYDFLDRFLRGAVSGVHILPFFPYSSDDGFSIIDYRAVHEGWGGLGDIRRIGSSFRLMVDLVLNHCSAESRWFRGFLAGEERYENWFITVPPGTDVSMIARPRTHPLLTPFRTARDDQSVWTTFSADQVDLNFEEPEVLLEMIRIFLFFIEQGAQIVRLDAIAYLWKEIGHPSIHHPKTHAVVRLFRTVIEEAAPWVTLITETNVPHEENLSYFGDGDEAHLVYQFPLPPLVLHTFLSGDASHLRDWARSLPPLAPGTSFFNFLASHDGIGVLPARGILSAEELEALIRGVRERGGLVSYKATAEGEIPYELNVNYRDAVTDPQASDAVRASQFLASQAIMLALPGVPGIYVHSILGSGNCPGCVRETGMNRSINREKLDLRETVRRISEAGSLPRLVFDGYRQLLDARRRSAAFHPAGGMIVPDAGGGLFAVIRVAPDGGERVLCLHNCGGERIRFDPGRLGESFPGPGQQPLRDLITGRGIVPAATGGRIELEPWQTLWLVPE